MHSMGYDRCDGYEAVQHDTKRYEHPRIQEPATESNTKSARLQFSQRPNPSHRGLLVAGIPYKYIVLHRREFLMMHTYAGVHAWYSN